MEAERLLAPTTNKKKSARRTKGAVDEMAASILLKTYLEQRANLAPAETEEEASDGE